MYSNLGVDWAASLLGFVCLGFMPIPWILRRYGPNLRAHSRYLTDRSGQGMIPL